MISPASHEYNDHLASPNLTQGHIAWGGHIPECTGGFEAGLQFYREALIYALRHNRFLLDEVLWGGGITTLLEPIISHCLEYGEEGRKMLIALSDWWRTGFNEVGVPRLDTISQVPEDISLFAAECAARERESGDGSPQKKVIECIESMLDSLS